MKIFHQSNQGEVDSLPCWSCRESICGAERCGITVILCNDKNEEVMAADLCGDDGEPEPVGGTGKEKDNLWMATMKGLK